MRRFVPADAGFLYDKFSVLGDNIKVTSGILFLNLHVHYMFHFSTTSGPVMGPAKNPINLLKPTGHVMHQQFNIQQLYALPTLYLYVLYLSENKQRLVPLTA